MRMTTIDENGIIKTEEFNHAGPDRLSPENLEVYNKVKHLIGSPYSELVRQQTESLTGRTTRQSGNCLVTMDCDPQRINLETNRNGIIEKILFI